MNYLNIYFFCFQDLFLYGFDKKQLNSIYLWLFT